MRCCVDINVVGVEAWLDRHEIGCAGLQFVVIPRGEMMIEFISFREDEFTFDEKNRFVKKGDEIVATFEEIELDYGPVRLLTPA